MNIYIKKFQDIDINDIAEVGGKNASLGEMYQKLTSKGISIPNGFAVTVQAYKEFIAFNGIGTDLKELLNSLDRIDFKNLSEIGAKARKLIMDGKFPRDVEISITNTFHDLFLDDNSSVAVRSSATAEDLADASFAGQHDSFLNVKGHNQLMYAVQKCFASLFTDRAIKYRDDKGFDHNKVYLSVGVQKMVRSDLSCSGIGFTIEPESGFSDIIHIAGTWGLGENIVQGTVTPDEFLVFKPSLKKKMRAVIQKNLGTKSMMMVYQDAEAGTTSTVNIDTPQKMQESFVLSDEELEKLANWAVTIETHYAKPMDFEWAKDGVDDSLYIIQARPETVHSQRKALEIKSYEIKEKSTVITNGEAIGSAITSGYAKILTSTDQGDKLNEGDILIADLTSPDWDPILKKVAGIVTNKGGRTSHASIIARELGVVAIVGTGNATETIKDGQLITLSCAEGKTGHVYDGKLEWDEKVIDTEKFKLPIIPKVQLIIAEPEKAFQLSLYPNHGVGLMRLEFIISNYLKVHPMALARFDKVTKEADRAEIESLTRLYESKEVYAIEKIAQGVATIAAAFYPKDVIVRMSDFKTNEYAGLIGGNDFEPSEENPMLGFRGASRYYNERYQEGFRLECEAMKVVRDEMGLTNVKLMIPFCRTVEEGKKVIEVMHKYGLQRGKNGLEIYVMSEIPSNVLLAEEFAKVFDGFSIGSNDLTQLTLGVDRDSELIADLFDEQNVASRQLIRMMIQKAKALKKKVGLCGQAPSDSPEFTKFLVEEGIDSISFNPDAVFRGIDNINYAIQQRQLDSTRSTLSGNASNDSVQPTNFSNTKE